MDVGLIGGSMPPIPKFDQASLQKEAERIFGVDVQAVGDGKFRVNGDESDKVKAALAFMLENLRNGHVGETARDLEELGKLVEHTLEKTPISDQEKAEVRKVFQEGAANIRQELARQQTALSGRTDGIPADQQAGLAALLERFSRESAGVEKALSQIEQILEEAKARDEAKAATASDDAAGDEEDESEASAGDDQEAAKTSADTGSQVDLVA